MAGVLDTYKDFCPHSPEPTHTVDRKTCRVRTMKPEFACVREMFACGKHFRCCINSHEHLHSQSSQITKFYVLSLFASATGTDLPQLQKNTTEYNPVIS